MSCVTFICKLNKCAVYCPPGFVDSFGTSGNIKEGDRRKKVLQTNLVINPKCDDPDIQLLLSFCKSL